MKESAAAATATTTASSVETSAPSLEHVATLNGETLPDQQQSAPVLKETQRQAISSGGSGARLRSPFSLALDSRPLIEVNRTLAQLALDAPLPPPTILDQVAQAVQEQRLFRVYMVREGDTLSAIAQRFGVHTDSLLWNNNELRDDPDFLKPGEELLVPSRDGIIYTVKLGDTLEEIAATYNVDIKDLLAVKGNKLSGPGDLTDGAVLLLPGAKPPVLLTVAAAPSAPAGAPSTPAGAPSAPSASAPSYGGSLQLGIQVQVAGAGGCLNSRANPGSDAINVCLPEGFVSVIVDGPRFVNGYWWWLLQGQGWSVDNYLHPYDGRKPPVTNPPASVGGFLWPVSGPITSLFGEPRGGSAYHTGIDIDVPEDSATPVRAAAAGRVVLVVSGWGYGLGNHIIIDHGNGLETVYAHLSRIAVALGQSVPQGAVIGNTGCTGYCLGEHLHFEIRKGGVPVNPLGYLP